MHHSLFEYIIHHNNKIFIKEINNIYFREILTYTCIMNDKIVNFLKSISIFLVGIVALDVAAILLLYTNFLELFPNLLKEEVLALSQTLIYGIGLAIILPLVGIKYLKEIIFDFKYTKNIKDGITLGIILLVTTMLYGLITGFFVKDTVPNDNETTIRTLVSVSPVMMGITLVILGPVYEEIVYRFGLFRTIKSINRPLAYIATAVVFGLIHFTFKSDPNEMINELIQLPSYIISGLILAYAYDRNESLSTSIIAHMINNIFAFLSALIVGLG